MQSNTFIKMLHSFCSPVTDEQLGTIIVGEVIFKVIFQLRTKAFDWQQNLWEKKAKIQQKNLRMVLMNYLSLLMNKLMS